MKTAKLIFILICVAIWLIKTFMDAYKQQQANRPTMGTPKRASGSPTLGSKPKPRVEPESSTWEDWVPAPTALPPSQSEPDLPPVLATSSRRTFDDEPAPLKPVGAPPPPLISEVANVDAKVADTIAHDLASSLTQPELEVMDVAGQTQAATAQVMSTSISAAFLKASKQARRMQRPAGRKVRLARCNRAMLRQGVLFSEVLARPRAFDV